MSETHELERLEGLAEAAIGAFGIHAPPVPIETMLREPPDGMWEEVDVSKMSGTFMSMRDQYSPRMSLARLLARHIADSAWGREHDLMHLLNDDKRVQTFARMLIMPRGMVLSMTVGSRNPMSIADEFEVPQDEARTRLAELF